MKPSTKVRCDTGPSNKVVEPVLIGMTNALASEIKYALHQNCNRCFFGYFIFYK